MFDEGNSNFLFKVVGFVAVLVFFAGVFVLQSGQRHKYVERARTYLENELDNWKAGKSCRISNLKPDDFKGTLSEWHNLKLDDYFVDNMSCHASRRHYRRRSLMYKIERLFPSKYYVYAKVELTFLDQDGNEYTYNVKYRLEPLNRENWLITIDKSLF